MNGLIASVKYFAYLMLLLLALAMLYGATMAVTYWTGINV